MELFDGEGRIDAYVVARADTYDYCCFSPEQSPEGALLARQIQAESYLNMRFVRPEGLVRLPGGEVVLAPDIADPSHGSVAAADTCWTEYSMGSEKGSSDIDPATGRLVAWKKYYAPLDKLPSYLFGKDHLWPGVEEELRRIDADPRLQLAEPEGLGKTKNAGPGVVTEFLRNEVQRAFVNGRTTGVGEVWLMGLVEKTVFRVWQRDWGTTAVRQVGDPKQLAHLYVYDDVKLVPTIMDIDNFFMNMADAITAPNNPHADRHLRNFVYMAEGVDDATLGKWLADFRQEARSAIESAN